MGSGPLRRQRADHPRRLAARPPRHVLRVAPGGPRPLALCDAVRKRPAGLRLPHAPAARRGVGALQALRLTTERGAAPAAVPAAGIRACRRPARAAAAGASAARSAARQRLPRGWWMAHRGWMARGRWMAHGGWMARRPGLPVTMTWDPCISASSLAAPVAAAKSGSGAMTVNREDFVAGAALMQTRSRRSAVGAVVDCVADGRRRSRAATRSTGGALAPPWAATRRLTAATIPTCDPARSGSGKGADCDADSNDRVGPDGRQHGAPPAARRAPVRGVRP
jgi:hypothetical protein